jgi:hypothetical protein
VSDRREEIERHIRLLKRLQADMERERRDDVRIIRVDKRTHRIRFEEETEDEVTVVVEKKAEKR